MWLCGGVKHGDGYPRAVGGLEEEAAFDQVYGAALVHVAVDVGGDVDLMLAVAVGVDLRACGPDGAGGFEIKFGQLEGGVLSRSAEEVAWRGVAAVLKNALGVAPLLVGGHRRKPGLQVEVIGHDG